MASALNAAAVAPPVHVVGLHHVAFAVYELDEGLRRLAHAGVPLIDQRPRRRGGGTRIAFLDPKACAGLLVEVVDVRPAAKPSATELR